jgi:putative oxidoreductase
MQLYRNLTALAGRVLLALIFVPSGFGKLTNPSRTAALMEHTGGIPHAIVYPLLAVTILIEFGCSLLLIFGFKARWAALLIFLWMIPVTLLFHFLPWREALAHGNTAVAMAQHGNFIKNVSIMGGLLMVASFGSGAWSVDGGK